MEPPVVKERIAGNIIIDVKTMRRRLGITAFDVWVSFLWRRSCEGYSFSSARSIARSQGLPYTSVRRACSKLTELRLIQDPKWVMNEAGLYRFRRKIVGDYRRGIILITDAAYTKISEKPAWGGSRKGAGRPCNAVPPIRDSTYIQVDTSIIQVGRTLKRGLKRGINSIPLKGNIMEADFPPPNSVYFSNLTKTGLKGLDEIPPVISESSTGDDLLFCDPNHGPGIDRPAETIFANVPLKRNLDPNKETRTVTDDKTHTRETPYIQVGQGVNPSNGKSVPMPPFPSVSFVGVPKVPAPPKLSDELSDEECVKKLAEAYRGAVEDRYNKRSYVMSRGDIKKNRYYLSFVECAHSVRDNDIPPVSWAAFMIDLLKVSCPKKPPTINRVFNLKKIESCLEWFNREAASYGGGRLLFTKKHKDILSRYDGLRRAAHKEKLTESLVEKHFPGGWECHYDEAKKESAVDQARLYDIVRRGGFIW